MRTIVGTVVFLFGGIASAAVSCDPAFNTQGILGQAATATGCLRAKDVELKPDPDPTAWSDFFVAWDITQSGSVYTYNYTVSDPTSPQKDIGHFLLGLSESCTTATISNTQGNNCIWSAPSSLLGIDTWDGQGNGNPGIPGDLYGVKFNGGSNTLTIAFNSDRAPVWQNFYAKDGTYMGGDTYVFNAGFGQTGANFYVAAPDTMVANPEPGLVGLLMAGMAGLFIANRRRRKSA